MSVRDDFLAFCETVCKRPLTAQQRALAEALVANSQGLVVIHTARQGSRVFVWDLVRNHVIDDEQVGTSALHETLGRQISILIFT